MAAFELNNMYNTREPRGPAKPTHHHEEDCTENNKPKEECIIALKVYDSCREQLCLKITPARGEDGIIVPPETAASVEIEDLRITDIEIVNKKPTIGKPGYWDITVRVCFEYTLVFQDVNGQEIEREDGVSCTTVKVTLFGSIGGDLVISSDLPMLSTTAQDAPFVLVEAKAIPLGAEINYRQGDTGPEPFDVTVIIGLWIVIKIFRIVNLLVESSGFCIPEECKEVETKHPCDIFYDMEFPMDVFAPPLKQDFNTVATGNFSSKKRKGCEDEVL